MPAMDCCGLPGAVCCMSYREQGARSCGRDGCVGEAGFATDRSRRCGGLRKFGPIIAGQFSRPPVVPRIDHERLGVGGFRSLREEEPDGKCD